MTVPKLPEDVLYAAYAAGDRAREKHPNYWSAHYGAVAEHVWAVAYAAGRASVPVRYGVQPDNGGLVYNHPKLTEKVVRAIAAGDPTGYHTAVRRFQSDWEPLPIEADSEAKP